MTIRLPLGTYSGVDIVEGLSFCLNDHPFYWSQLQAFQDRFGSAAGTLARQILDARWSEAELLAHSIKGTSSMLGLPRVCGAAATLDRALKTACDAGRAPDDTLDCLHQLKLALAQTAAGLQEIAARIEHA